MNVNLPEVSNIETLTELSRFMSVVVRSINSVLSGRIGLVDNCETSVVTVTVVTANVDVPVNHTLKRMPNGYIMVGSSAAVTVYDGALPGNLEQLFIRSSGAGTVKLLVF